MSKRHPSSLKKYCVKTYGCQMNELDSQVICGVLEKRGLEPASEEEADLLLFNTCSIRDLAERKVMGKIGLLGRKKRRQILGIAGCMVTAKREALLKKFPHVDFLIGPNDIGQLELALNQVIEREARVCYASPQFSEELDYLTARREKGVKAYVSIIRGCNKHCTYCVVPYTRGPEVSRSVESILEECRHLTEQGYRELTLLGQNVNSYGKDFSSPFLFADLLEKIDQIPGIGRIRFLTSHPVDISKQLMEAVRDLPSLCEQVHFPIQSGSNRILRKMHRMYTVEEYLEKVALLREIVGEQVSLGTDIIVGFPSESEEDFRKTYEVMEEVEYEPTSFLYTYSSRKGTPAVRWEDDVPESIKEERLQILMNLQTRIRNRKFEQKVGTTQEVLVERKNRDDGQLKGGTRRGEKVAFRSSSNETLQDVRITGYSCETLIGHKVEVA